MERIRRAMAIALVTMTGAAAAAGGAQAAQGLVVQKREAGTQLLAHRYEAGPTGSQKLTVVVKPNTDFKTVTLLDFDRDGSPEGYVNMYWNAPTQKVVWQLWVLTKDPMTRALGSGGGTCFVPAPTAYARNSGIDPGGHDVALDKRSGSWSATVTADLDQEFGDNARYQPRMVTVYTPQANALGNSLTVDDVLPDSAAPGVAPADTGCLGRSPDESSGPYRQGFLISPDGWSDRGQVTGPPVRRQTMFDNDDNSGTTTDLLEADVEQYNASQQQGDVTGGAADATAPSTAAFHPSDLVLRFDPAGGTASGTYLFADGANAPSGLVTTDAGADAGHATVQLHYNLTGLSGDRCYPRAATAKLSSGGNTRWGPDPLTLTLPITTDEQGRKVVRVALDHLTGVYQQAAGDALAFKWVTAGARGSLDPDYVPNTLNAPFCTFPGDNSPGTYVKASEAIRMGGTLPSTTLTASTTSPGITDPVTLTAGGGTSFRFQPHDADGFDANYGAATRSGVVYPASTTARVLARSSDGVNQMAQLRIAPANTPPVAGWAASGPPQPWLLGDPSGISVVWNDDSHDVDPGSQIRAQSWTLTNVRTGKAYTSATTSIAHTFVVGDQGDWQLTHTVTDDDGAQATKTLTYALIQPPVAIIDKITPCAGSVCSDDPGPIVWNQYSGGQYKAWARTATDGSLGSRGPLEYWFQWEPPNGSYNLWTQGYGQSFFAFPGSYTINMYVKDADGRQSATTSARVNVRRPGDTPPTAHATFAPAQPQSGDDVLIDASASVLNNPDGTTEKPFRFRYDFGDGTAPVATDQDAVHHVFAGSGLYHVTVVAIDDRSFADDTESDPLTLDVRVTPGAVDANAPLPKLVRLAPAGKVYADRDVQLSAAGTTVKTGPATYAFDLDGDGSFETDVGTQAILTRASPPRATATSACA